MSYWLLSSYKCRCRVIYNVASAQPQERQAEIPPALQPGLAPKTPETLLKEANDISKQHPEGAIWLLLEALVLKPDFLPARRELAAIYERQNKWDMAINEREAINRAEGTPESIADLVTAMEKAGFFLTAAQAATTAYAKYPDKPILLLKAGELYFKAGADNDALSSLQEFIKRDPRQGRPFLLMGNIHERAGRLPAALDAYLKARELLKDSPEAAEALQRLRARTVEVEGLWVFIPEGWIAEKNGLRNILQNQRIIITWVGAGNPQELAWQRARELMPGNLFSDEMLKSYESMRMMKEEMAKFGVAAKDLPDIPLPIFHRKELTGPPAAHLASLAASERPQTGMESVCVAAVTHAGRTYLLAWQAHMPPVHGEETLAAILKQVLWPR